MTQEGLLEIEDIMESLVIDRKFVLVDSSKYTEGAFAYILNKIDEVGSIGFISDLMKIYAQGRFYSDFDTLRFFKSIGKGSYDNLERFGISYLFNARTNSDTLSFVGKGYTTIELDAENNAVIVDTDISAMEDATKDILQRLYRIEISYATQEYVADNYQEILVPGAYIQINEDNVITTYDLVSYSYAFENYATYSYIAENNEYFYNFERYVRNNYADRIETKQIAFEEAEKAVAKVVDGAPNVFDTLKEIAEWIVDSGKYILVNPDELDESGNTKYYVKEYSEIDNTKIDRSGETDYYDYSCNEIYKEIKFDEAVEGNEYYYKEGDDYIKADEVIRVYDEVSADNVNLENPGNYFIKDNEDNYVIVPKEESLNIAFVNVEPVLIDLQDGKSYFYKDENNNYVKVTSYDDVDTESDKEYFIGVYEVQYYEGNYDKQYYEKEITDYSYRLVTTTEIDNNPDKVYYELNYVDAEYPLDTTGDTDYYIYSSTSAAEILNEISELKETVGNEYYFTYLDENNQKKIYDGTVSSLTHIQDNNYLLEDNDGNLFEVSYISSTGLFNKIEIADEELSQRIDEVNARLDSLLESFNGLLYKLYADTNTSYAYLTFDEYEYKGWSERTIIMNLVEADFDNNEESSYYGQVLQNGLTTAYTVNSMLDYRNGWVILQGPEELPPITITRIKMMYDEETGKRSLIANTENYPEEPIEEIIFNWIVSFDDEDVEIQTNIPELEFNEELLDKYDTAVYVKVICSVEDFESNMYIVKKPEE